MQQILHIFIGAIVKELQKINTNKSMVNFTKIDTLENFRMKEKIYE